MSASAYTSTISMVTGDFIWKPQARISSNMQVNETLDAYSY